MHELAMVDAIPFESVGVVNSQSYYNIDNVCDADCQGFSC